MIFLYIKKVIKKKIEEHKKYKIFYLIALVHIISYFLFREYRKNRCLIDPPSEFFYKYRKLANYFSIPLLICSRYLKKKNILISVNNNCNFSTGHIYGEIKLLYRMQKTIYKHSCPTIWFTTSRKEILGDTKNIFENKNFKVLFGGIKRILLTFVAIKDPSISIDASMGFDDYIHNSRPLKPRADYFDKPKKRIELYVKTRKFHPMKEKLSVYFDEAKKLMQNLKITNRYIVIQIKTMSVNGTLEPLNPDSLLKSIKYFQNKKYQIVFAGREQFPDIFLNKSIINYANSIYASALNDFLLIGHCSLVIASASGFCFIPENLDKPLLIVNAHHIAQNPGQRTIYVPTLISRSSKTFNAKIQFEYLCRYGPDCGYKKFDDLYILHKPTSEEIFMAAKELEGMLSGIIPPFTPLQKKIRDEDGCPLLSCGLSRISDYYLTKHGFFFEKK